jgi:hypothetical protein
MSGIIGSQFNNRGSGLIKSQLQTGSIANDVLDSDHYVDGSIDTAHIATNAIDGTLTKDALIADYSDVTITASDLIMYGDATDSNNTKRDTVQGILDLVSAGGFTLDTAVATTSGSQINITGIPSGTTMVLVMLQGVGTNGTNALKLVLGDSGGLEGTDYKGTAASSIASSAGESNHSGNFTIVRALTASIAYSGCFILAKQNTDHTWVLTGSAGADDTNTQHFSASGSKTLSAELTQLRLQTADSFDEGEINLAFL